MDEVPETIPESIPDGLLTYFMNHQNGQLINIENLVHIPKLDYESSDADVITFTRDNAPVSPGLGFRVDRCGVQVLIIGNSVW